MIKGQQAGALDFLNTWVEKPVKEEAVAVLRGYAGTGKTWLVGHWLEDVVSRHPKWNIVVMAPTNKALDVLRTKCGEIPNVTFRTVDSFLGNRIKKNDDGEMERSQGKSADEPDLAICDEGSMLKEEYDIALRRKRMKLLYVADPAQLPPINEQISSIFKIDNYFEMTEVVRYDGAIIKVATFLRERIQSGEMFILRDIMNFRDTERALSFIRLSEMHDWALQAIKKGLDQRIVAFTNAEVNSHNSIMHRALFPDAPFFGVGERVVVNETFELPKTDPDSEDTDMLYNGEMLTVTSCERAEDVAGVVIYNVGITRKEAILLEVDGKLVEQVSDYVLQVAADEGHMLSVHRSLTNQIYEARRNNEPHSEIKKLLDLRRPLNQLAPLRHSYACTVHKSQGSTYDIAFCDWSSIYRSQDRARMMYVAATRPSKYLVVAAK